MTTKPVKTYSQWSESRQDLSKFLQIGDIVDEEIVEYFLNVLPPKTWNNSVIQIGEACDYVEGKATYSTLKILLMVGHGPENATKDRRKIKLMN